MLHRFTEATDFDLRRQIAELQLVTSSPSAAKNLADNYTGLTSSSSRGRFGPEVPRGDCVLSTDRKAEFGFRPSALGSLWSDLVEVVTGTMASIQRARGTEMPGVSRRSGGRERDR